MQALAFSFADTFLKFYTVVVIPLTYRCDYMDSCGPSIGVTIVITSTVFLIIAIVKIIEHINIASFVRHQMLENVESL